MNPENRKLAILFLAAFSRAAASGAERGPVYPPHFEWGSALSAHQSEGVQGGGQDSDWYALEHSTPSPIGQGDTADLATDFWNRYPEDIALAKRMGLTVLRTSIAWEKVEPAPGKFDEAVIGHYREMLKEMRRQGIRPMLALHHFTHPQWFVRKGHWLSPESPRDFLRYARHVVERLSDLCDLWITFNEPMIVVMEGYVTGEYPPRMKSPGAGFEAGYNLARAHRMVTAMIHEVQGAAPAEGGLHGVGLANSWQLYEPLHRWNPLDRVAAGIVAETMNWAFMRAANGESWKIPFAPFSAFSWKGFFKRPRRMPSADLRGLRGSPRVDWIGINYYSCYKIGLSMGKGGISWNKPTGRPTGDNGWAICPEGLETLIRQAAREFPGFPLVVSENGLADATDSRRPAFIRDHLLSVDRALGGSPAGPPIDLRGYFHWSLTDNFEWIYGYRYRFGLTEIRFDDGLRRVPRASSRVYAAEIRKRRSRARK